MKYNYRYLARVIIEAETPLALGSGNRELSTDRPVAKDANGIPYLPGTSLAGVIRHSLYEQTGDNNEILSRLDDVFGYQDETNQGDSLGARLILSSAHLIGKNHKVFDGLFVIDKNDPNYEFIGMYRNLPVRQHARINHRGVADKENYGKFDEEVVYKGSRFVFELEMKGTDDTDNTFWKQLLSVLSLPGFRIGGGSTKGFGQIKVIEIKQQIFNLDNDKDRNNYLNHSTCLNIPFEGDTFKPEEKSSVTFDIYQLRLIPEDFFLFSSGLKSDFADMNPVTEQILSWNNSEDPVFSKEMVLIPATSVKGAIAHRVAYHYNKLNEIYADKLPEDKTIADYTGENNVAVRTLFGNAGDYSNEEEGQRGKIWFSDVYRKGHAYKKLDHVVIDRFTGGAIDGALFNERVVQDDSAGENECILELMVQQGAFDNTDDNNIKKAFEQSLEDIISGRLPLGGGTLRGHGIFTGELIKPND